MSEAKIGMKLLVDKSKDKVLFAEAGKECVDFFLHILSLPLGTVVSYLTKASMVGSLGSLYGSLESLSTDYLQDSSDLIKDCLLNPKPAAGSASNVPLLTVSPAIDDVPGVKKFYTCRHVLSRSYNNVNHLYVSDAQGAKCINCLELMEQQLTYVADPVTRVKPKGPGVGGYVKGVVTYMIMDDLSVQPMSTISSIALLNKFNVQDVGRLEEQEVTLDINLGVALMKASLMSKTVLTDVFLGKKAAAN